MWFKQAQRKKVKLKLWLFGPSWSWKTMSALKLARGLTDDRSKIAILDTENWSASLYADLGAYATNILTPPYSPDRYIEQIKEAYLAGFEVLIIDSISHEWNWPGGIMDIKNKMTWNDFAKWATLTPLHNTFWTAILQVPMHVIVTGRTKEDYSMVTGTDWRLKVEKAGTTIIQRDGAEYELTIAFTLDIKHNATSSKDRTNTFMDKPPFVISEETGKKLRAWCDLWVNEKADDKTKSEQDSDWWQDTSKEVQDTKGG